MDNIKFIGRKNIFSESLLLRKMSDAFFSLSFDFVAILCYWRLISKVLQTAVEYDFIVIKTISNNEIFIFCLSKEQHSKAIIVIIIIIMALITSANGIW